MQSLLLVFLIGFLLLASQRHELREPNGRLIGVITCDSQKCVARDARQVLKGYYIIKSNETRDASWRLVARGNVLSSLLR